MEYKLHLKLFYGISSKVSLMLILVIFCIYDSQAQVKIGSNPNQIQPSSILELESQTKGLLLPRLADTITINSLNPSDGMLIYLEKTPKNGLYVRRNGVWNFLSGISNTTIGGGTSIDETKLNLANLGGKIDPATQMSATPGTVSGQVLTWNGTSWEPKSILQVSTTIVEKAKEFNTTSGGNVILEPNSTNTVKVPVSGAVPGDIVFVALIGDTPDFAVYNAWVSANNEVTIRFANYQADPVTIIGTQYKVLLMK
ncbi:hypothetical protein [Daejeonella sp. H1SJ63]|jgi:hypothetical protein|uniref:hypothetical protein n=1 Tax=Daejeonella sp. H1SJ63 TaxID=3034145 RepID=UPI0023EDB320|nr:hypothetical protein [Daejeonella sp. H1SJ63]